MTIGDFLSVIENLPLNTSINTEIRIEDDFGEITIIGIGLDKRQDSMFNEITALVIRLEHSK